MHTMISVKELEEHIDNYENSGEEKIIDKQPQPEEDGNQPVAKHTLKTTRTYNFNEIVNGKKMKRIMYDSARFPRPSIQHRKWLSTMRNHMHQGFFFIIFDPLGTTVDLPRLVPFFFNVKQLADFLKSKFAPMSTGFLAPLEEIDDLKHRRTLQPQNM